MVRKEARPTSGGFSFLGLVIAFIIATLALWYHDKSDDECQSKGGVLVRGAYGYECVKAARLDR